MGTYSSNNADKNNDNSASNATEPSQSASGSNILSKGKYKVELAASVLGGSGPFTAYHTSVLIDGREYFFDMGGVMKTDNLLSHQGKQQLIRTEIGYTNKTGSQLENKLRPYFESGSYDLLRKNCNTFSDCALWFLCRQRLAAQYNRMERLGNSEMFGSLVQGGEYKPNPKADGFDKDKVIDLCKDVFEKTSGKSMGGQNADSKDAMRAKRLAMLEKSMGK